MKLFSCQGCGQLLYFENVRCENCQRLLGYLSDITEISALDPLPGDDVRWGRLESAKHRLFYSLLRLNLPLETRGENPEHGLAFDFLADPPESHAAGVLTGHDS